MENNDIGRWVKEERGARGLSQDALADAIGADDDGKPLVHVNTIKNLELGKTKRPSAQTLSALRKFFGTEPTAEEIEAKVDRHTGSFLDLVGAYLMSLPADRRLDKIFELTRQVLSGR